MATPGLFKVVHHLDVIDEGWTDRTGVTGYGVEPYIPRLGFMFNPADYVADSSTYEPEVCADNPTGSAINVTIVRVDNSAVVGTVSVAAGATGGTRFRGAAITWPAGNHEYAWYVVGAANVEFFLYTGRIVCTHVNPTKLKLWHPLVNYTEEDCDGVVNQIDLLATSDPLQYSAWSGVFQRNDSEHSATSRSWGIESILGKGSGHINIRSGLYNVTLGQRVTASLVLGDVAQTAIVAALKWTTDPAWVDQHFYRWFWEEVAPGGDPAKVYGARLYTYLVGDIQKVTARLRISKGGGSTVTDINPTSRVKIDDNTSVLSVLTEMSGYNSAGLGKVETMDGGTSDTGETGTAVAAADISVSTSLAVYSSADWTPIVGNRYFERDAPVTAASSIHVDWVLIRVTYQVSTTGVCPAHGVVEDVTPYAILTCPEDPCDYP